jgi:hypothetical protein
MARQPDDDDQRAASSEDLLASVRRTLLRTEIAVSRSKPRDSSNEARSG